MPRTESQTSVLKKTFYSYKLYFSSDLVKDSRPTLNKNISVFSFSCQPYSLPVSSRVSSCIDRSAHHPCVHTRTGYQYYPVTLYLYLYQVQRWVFLNMVFRDFLPFSFYSLVCWFRFFRFYCFRTTVFTYCLHWNFNLYKYLTEQCQK